MYDIKFLKLENLHPLDVESLALVQLEINSSKETGENTSSPLVVFHYLAPGWYAALVSC